MAETDNKKPSLVVAGEDHPHHHVPKPSKTIFGMLALAIFSVIVAFGLQWNQDRNKIPVVCKDDILQQANDNLDISKTKELQPTADKIQKLKNFDKDPNCVIILANYYVNVQDTKNGRLYYDKLVYLETNKHAKISPKLTHAKGSGSLKPVIEFMEQQQKQKPSSGQSQGGWNANVH